MKRPNVERDLRGGEVTHRFMISVFGLIMNEPKYKRATD
jgi:hypothetical protein